MKVNIGLVLFLASLSTVYGAATTDFLTSLSPPACRDACSALAQSVGGCLEDLNATYSASINTSDPASFQTTGDLMALKNCACSSDAFDAAESCMSCLSEQACIKDNPVTVDDYRNICEQGPPALQSVHNRYHTMTCSAGGETSSPTPSSTESSSSSATPSPTESSSSAPSSTASPTQSSSSAPSSSATPTQSSSSSSAPSSSASPTQSSSASPSPTNGGAMQSGKGGAGKAQGQGKGQGQQSADCQHNTAAAIAVAGGKSGSQGGSQNGPSGKRRRR